MRNNSCPEPDVIVQRARSARGRPRESAVWRLDLMAPQRLPGHPVVKVRECFGAVVVADPQIGAGGLTPNVKTRLAANPWILVHFTPTSGSWLNLAAATR